VSGPAERPDAGDRPRPGESLEGWAPVPRPDLTLAEVIELAFDYRGNVTVVGTDGSERVGFVFNREAGAPEPFLQMFDEAGDGPITIPYARVATVRFSGRDPAAGKSWKAWQERKQGERVGSPAAAPATEGP
jgi:hypothetical protein